MTSRTRMARLAEVDLERSRDTGCNLSVLRLHIIWGPRGAQWNLFGPLLGTKPLAPKYPFERNIGDAQLLRFRHDESRDVGREFLPVWPLLYC